MLGRPEIGIKSLKQFINSNPLVLVGCHKRTEEGLGARSKCGLRAVRKRKATLGRRETEVSLGTW